MYEAGTAGARRGARVEATELARRFGAQLVLDRLSLAIEPGETFALLGANGAGKTTFVRLVIGYLVPTAGRVTVDGLSPETAPRAVHARLGYVAETSRLYPDLRVHGLLRFAGQVRGLAGAALHEAVERMLQRFDLTSVSGRLVGNLSKGYQQRDLWPRPLFTIRRSSWWTNPRAASTRSSSSRCASSCAPWPASAR